MSELSVNDHLEGILSDFEALKRSFDIEDVDDIPSSFSTASPVSNPVSPSSSHFFLNHNKAGEVRGGGDQSPSLAFNNNNNNSLSPGAHHARISLSANPSPVFKSRNVVSSMSFNRGTMNRPAIHSNGSSVTRAASFQSRLNSYSMLSGPGSDNDSLHSSTSSLEYPGVVGSALPPTKLGSYPSPLLQGEYLRTQPQLPQQHPERGANLGSNPHLKKFSSHGSVFPPEMDHSSGIMLGVPEPRRVNHGSMSNVDLQIHDGGGGGGGMGGMQRGGSAGMISPGLRYANANWNGHVHNASSYGEEGYYSSKKNGHQQVPEILKPLQPKPKETPRLNKFPLDLDSLVSSTSTTSPTKAQGGSMNRSPPKPPIRNTAGLQHTSSPSSSASPSASLSSLDSSSDTPPISLHHPFLPLSSCSPTPSHGPIPVPEMSWPVSPAQSPRLEILSGSQVAQVFPNLPTPYSPSNSASNSRAMRSVEVGVGEARDSVGSILQRIASFSRDAVTDITPDVVMQCPEVQTNGGPSSKFGRPAETTPVTPRKLGKKTQEESAGKQETEPLATMEESPDPERGIMGKEQQDEAKSQGPAASVNTHNALPGTDTQDNHVGLHTETEEREKGMEERELQKELEAKVKVDRCQTVPGLNMSHIHGSDLFGYVGIEAVLDQMRHKTMKAGFEFNIMVVGQSGLGKSTLVNTLFKSKVSRKSCTPNYEEKTSKTVKMHSVSHLIEEKGVKMKLTVIDTPGFGDQINNDNCWEPIVKYVNEQYEKYLREELNVNRKRRIPDSRVHCCIYFLPATGHRLRPIDVEFMKRLGKIVSIVPVIAKADTLTIEERQEFKERIRQDLAANGICVYPQKEFDEDPDEQILNDRIRESIPFAVVGTDKEHQVNGNKVLGRKTKWGIIEVENVEHCEFANLRDLLIRSHLQDLKDVTHNIHYEAYRVHRLNQSNMNFTELGLNTWLNGTEDICESESHL